MVAVDTNNPPAKVVVRPEDILSNTENHTVIRGVKIRKGTVGAFLDNLERLETASPEEKEQILELQTELAPGLAAIRLPSYFKCVNPEVQAILDEAERVLKEKEA